MHLDFYSFLNIISKKKFIFITKVDQKFLISKDRLHVSCQFDPQSSLTTVDIQNNDFTFAVRLIPSQV